MAIYIKDKVRGLRMGGGSPSRVKVYKANPDGSRGKFLRTQSPTFDVPDHHKHIQIGKGRVEIK